MPDEKFASDEHELLQDITAPMPRPADHEASALDEVEFPIVLRGYDRLAVDAWVKQTRRELEELRASSSPDAAVRRALERVGEEVSGILQRAHQTAERITSQSRSEAEDRLEAARSEATQIRSRAEAQLTDLDSETDRIWAERHRLVEDARDLAGQLLALADSAAERFPPADDTETGETAVGPGHPAASAHPAPGEDTHPAPGEDTAPWELEAAQPDEE